MTLYRRGVIAWAEAVWCFLHLGKRAVDIVISASRPVCAFRQPLSVSNKLPKAYWQPVASSPGKAGEQRVAPLNVRIAVFP